MADIGVGIIGASPKPSSWAAGAHIPALRAVPGLRLRAVATSRRASADAAAAAYGVDAFDDPRALVDHPGVDLVVVSVRVPQHHALIGQALAAGKMVYSDWPLGVDLAQAQELAKAAAGIRTFVGLQSRFTTAVPRMKQLVADGYVGRVLATTLVGSATGWSATTDRDHAYLFDAANGATPLTVTTGHALDALTHVLGDITRVTATLGTGRREVTVTDTDTTIPVTAPDQIAVTATLRSGAIASVFYRGGTSRADNLRWEINGTTGDLLVTSRTPNGNIQLADLTLAGGNGATTTVSPLPLPPTAAHLAGPARTMAALYTALADDLAHDTHEVPDFTHAVTIHGLLADIEAAAHE